MNAPNPLLLPWTGLAGGGPPLDQVTPTILRDAVLHAISVERDEVDAVRPCTAPPTFDNTVLALEEAGELLRGVSSVYSTWGLSFSGPEIRELRRELEPLLAARTDGIYQDPVLFQRVKAACALPGLTDVQRRLGKRIVEFFEDAGAHLDEAGRTQVGQINQRLSALYAEFSDRLLADEEDIVTWLDKDGLAGLPAGFVGSCRAAAVARGRPDAWAVLNTRSAVEPFLIHAQRRDLREQVWRAFVGRGADRPATATQVLIREILQLRRDRARVLGFVSHAHLSLARTMAGTPDRAVALMRRVWGPAADAFKREVAAMQAVADAEGAGISIAPWDTRHYGEKVRQAEHDIDPVELQRYLRLDPLREGMFWAANQNFGWSFCELDVPVGHPDVRVWLVSDREGAELGVFHFDPFARPGKRSGAWMNTYRVQTTKDGARVPPIVLNTCNFMRPSEGEPATLTMDEARTLFHEFGHAMHGLASAVPYRSLAGTAVPRDFVEFPSQLNEHWLTTSALVERFARDVETDAPLPAALLERVKAASNADSGFRTMELLASAVVDMMLHLADDVPDPDAFEAQVLEEWGLPAELVMRHRTPQFAHIFSGDGYAAGYYSYLWADTLVADAAEAFAEHGFYNGDLASKYYQTVLTQGHMADADVTFRAFRGRDPDVSALLRDRGLVDAEGADPG